MSLSALVGYLLAWIWWSDKAQDGDSVLSAVRQKLELAQREIDAQTQALEQRERTIAERDRALSDAQAKIAALEGQLGNTQNHYWEQFQHSVVTQEGEIADLRGRFVEQGHQIRRLQDENNRLRARAGVQPQPELGTEPEPSTHLDPQLDIDNSPEHFSLDPAADNADVQPDHAPNEADDDDEGLQAAFDTEFGIHDTQLPSAASPSENADEDNDDDGLFAAFSTEFGINDESLPVAEEPSPLESEDTALSLDEEPISIDDDTPLSLDETPLSLDETQSDDAFSLEGEPEPASEQPPADDLVSAFENDFSLEDLSKS